MLTDMVVVESDDEEDGKKTTVDGRPMGVANEDPISGEDDGVVVDSNTVHSSPQSSPSRSSPSPVQAPLRKGGMKRGSSGPARGGWLKKKRG